VKAAALVALASTGCLLVPTREITSHAVATRNGPARVEVGAIALHASLEGDSVRVQVVQERSCLHEVYVQMEDKSELASKLVAPGLGDVGSCHLEGSRCVFLLIVYAVGSLITLPVSTVVTVITVGVSEPQITRRWVHEATERTACPVAVPDRSVQLWLPSRVVANGITDATGTWSFAIPGNELDGLVTARIAGAPPQTIELRRRTAERSPP